MKNISAVTIGKLIEAYIEHDDKKFMSYANFIAEAYEESGEERSAKIIRSKISGEYKKRPKITLNKEEQDKNFFALLVMLGVLKHNGCYHQFYTVHDGKEYNGPIHIDGSGDMSDGHGHKIRFR